MPKLNSLGATVYTQQELKNIKTYAIPSAAKKSSTDTAIYRSVLSPNDLITGMPDATIIDLFELGMSLNPKANCLGFRTCSFDPITGLPIKWNGYSWLTFEQVAERRMDFGRGMQFIHDQVLQMPPNEKWNMGVYSLNRPEWVIADFGAHMFANATVALYDTLGPEACQFIINHSGIPLIVTSLDKVANILKISDECPTLKAIVVMDDNFPSLKDTSYAPFKLVKHWAQEKGLNIYTFSEVQSMGKTNLIPPRLPKPSDVFCICYTSGTTGNPKGALLSHKNMVSILAAAEFQVELLSTDVHISYLPLAHIFERVMMISVLAKGASAGFFRGDISLLIEDISELKPTIFASVPRLLNRIYDKITNQALSAGGVKKYLFETALNAKLENLKTGSLNHAVWDRLVFSKVKAALGGRVRIIITASAPISSTILDFLRVAFSCEVLEAYGQTECTGGFTMTLIGDYSKGNVGGVLSCSELKLVSVPEMRYLAENNKGEIWIRGPTVFLGYHKDVAKTNEALTSDGWLKTGDIGSIDGKGRLSIIDRKKNIFKLSHGEYVAPEKIENTYTKSNFIAQIFVHGDSLQSELVAIVVPDPEIGIAWGKEKGYLAPDTAPGIATPVPGMPPHPGMIKLCGMKEFKDAIIQDMGKHAMADKLRGFEYVKGLYLEPRFFSVETGLLTPTYKLKRADAAEYYKGIITELYKDLNQKSPSPKL